MIHGHARLVFGVLLPSDVWECLVSSEFSGRDTGTAGSVDTSSFHPYHCCRRFHLLFLFHRQGSGGSKKAGHLLKFSGRSWVLNTEARSELELGLKPELLGPQGKSHVSLREMPFISALLKGPQPEGPSLLSHANVGCLVPLCGALAKDPSVSGAVETENLDSGHRPDFSHQQEAIPQLDNH